MSLREGKRSETNHRLQNSVKPILCSSNQPPPPLISDNQKDSSCSCPPFDCICNDLLNQMQSYQQHLTNISCHSSNGYDASPYSHSAEQTANGYYNASQSNEMLFQSCDFVPFHGDIFQPEEIFQLDQPLRPSDQGQTDSARSPTIILDLGNGTNQRDLVKFEPPAWACRNQSGTTDDNSNSCGRYPVCSTNSNFSVFQQPGMDFAKIQDCQEHYGNGLLKSEENYEDRDSSFLFNSDLSCEKLKNNSNILNSEIDPRYLCFSSEESSMDQDCVPEMRYNLTDDIRQDVSDPKAYNPPEMECKLNVKNYSTDYGMFQDVLPHQDNFVDYHHHSVNKVCGNFEHGYDQKPISDPLYFLEHADVRGPCENDAINSYLQPSQIFNNQSHFQHATN